MQVFYKVAKLLLDDAAKLNLDWNALRLMSDVSDNHPT